jgi:hypothetical protein
LLLTHSTAFRFHISEFHVGPLVSFLSNNDLSFAAGQDHQAKILKLLNGITAPHAL